MSELHPQIQALLGGAMDEPPEGGTVEEVLAALRSAYARNAALYGGPVQDVARVRDVEIPRADGGVIPARAYWPVAPAGGLIVWFHGGGWIYGDLDGFDRVCRAIANAAGAQVLSVDYRLTPEHPFPAGLQDARRALAWARGAEGAGVLGHDPARVVVGGDSAGGNLAASAALSTRTDGGPPLVAQMLVYPVTDASMAGESYTTWAEGPMLTAADMAGAWEIYLDGHDRADPDASPLLADVAGAPPALVLLARVDPLCDDGLAYAERLRAAGVEARVSVYEDMTHGFLRWGGVVDRANEAAAELAAFARARISGS